MLLYTFERLKTIAYAANSQMLLIRDKREASEPLHRHDYYELVYIYDGESVHVVNNISYKANAGTLLLLTPNDTHSFISPHEVSLINVCFLPKNGVSDSKYMRFANPTAHLDSQGTVEMETLLYLAEQELNMKDSSSDSIIDHCLEWMLLLFKRSNTDPSHPDPVWSRLLTELADNYSTMTLNRAAEIVGVSTSHFCRIFSRDFSMTFHTYLRTIKIRQAKHMLLTTDYSVSEIAEVVGYTHNPCRFYSNFKNIVGMTPHAFRNSFKNDSQQNTTIRSFIPEPNGALPEFFSPYEEK